MKIFKPAVKTHCENGHELTADNVKYTFHDNSVSKVCRTCANNHLKLRYDTDETYRQKKIEYQRNYRKMKREAKSDAL
jgi:hypothetical protein